MFGRDAETYSQELGGLLLAVDGHTAVLCVRHGKGAVGDKGFDSG